jgi:hypothetical protein
VSRVDKARAFAIARAECVEAIAAVEMASRRRLADARDFERVGVVGNRLFSMLTKLCR